jgi:uncharacterized ion transporter superfamily protein YfcC
MRAPDTVVIVFALVAGAAALSWVVPPGAYERREMVVEGVGTRQVVVPGTFAYLPADQTALVPRLADTVGTIFKAPILGMTDPEAAPIIAFVLLIGGAFAVLQRTGAVDAALRRLARASRRSPVLETLLIPICMTAFSLGGAIFGMAEETVPFVLVFVPLALALGYDSVTGAAIPFIGAAVGFAAAFLNPFTIGVAQGIAGVPLFSGAGLRVGLWLVATALAIAFVMWHAARVRRDPSRSPTWAADEERRRAVVMESGIDDQPLSRRQVAVLLAGTIGIGVLVWGVLPPSQGGAGWYITEIAALFVALGVAIGAIGGLGAGGTAGAFMDGIRQLAPTAVIIGLARGILVVLQEGRIIDTILHSMALALDGTSASGAALTMFAAQTVLNTIIPSGSGQAALTMPLMAPLADLVGVTRQTAVLAFQMGDGFTNMIVPTSAVLMGVLTLAGIPWTQWARWVLPLQGLFVLLGAAVLLVAVAIGYA